jgi:hypothetical protein
MFHLLLTVWQQQIEIPSRAEEKDWDLQASSLALLKEMMYVLDLAYRIGTKADRKAADKLQRKLLHDDLRQSGLFPLLCRMVKNYNPRIQPKNQAGDMMEALYIIIRTFERLDSTERGGFIVRQRAAKRRPQQQQKQKDTTATNGASAEGKTPEQAGKPEEGVSVGIDENVDGRSKEDGNAEKAMPEAEDGKPKEPEAEGSEKEKEKATTDAAEEIPSNGQEQEEKSMSKDPLEQLENESETDSDAKMALKESTFDLNHRLSQELTAPLLIQTLTSVLETYKTNGSQLNNSIVGILKRVVLPDCLNLMPCVWHLSFLMVVEKILSDSAIKKNPSFSPMLQLCNYITRKLMDRLLPDLTGDLDSFQKSAKESLARITFVDLLFWKNRKDAEMLRDEYGWHNKFAHREAIRKALADEDEACGAGILKSIDKLAPSSTKAFTSEDEEDLTEAYNKFKGKGEEDMNVMIDCIAEELHFRFKPRQLKKELRNLGLIAKTAPKKAKSKLSEEDRETLMGLWRKHKDDENRMKAIAEGFEFKYTTRKLTSELRILGLMEKKKAPARITEEQVTLVKEAFHKHKSSATYLHDIENEVADQGLSKSQINRLLKKFGLERKKITRLADSSDESNSDSDSDSDQAAAAATKAKAKASSSPWEVAQQSSSSSGSGGSDSQSSDGDDSSSSDSSNSDSANSSSSSSSESNEDSAAAEVEGADEVEADGLKGNKSPSPSLASPDIDMDMDPKESNPTEEEQPMPPIQPEERKQTNKKKKKKRKNNLLASSTATKAKTPQPKKRRVLKKAGDKPKTQSMTMFEDEDLDDNLTEATPVAEKKQSQNFLLDSDSE